MDAYSKKVSAVDQLKESEKQLLTIQQYEDDLSAYQYYISAVGKDGVPYQIISDAIPKIEQEVNNILSHIVEFSVSIETDGKNVNVYIKYEDKKWPLELCSGMEKFISGLALRVALINVSNLPRPNYLVVDEGFSALDGHNIPMLHALFDYLKRNFDFIIIISHLDAMRDMVDKQLEIKKENGFSKIDNTV
jgi:DNA repair exonuclease SbcCD ATPase subunit